MPPPRRSSGPSALAAGLAATLALLALARPAGAADDPARRRFDADPHRLALSLDGGFGAETAAAAPAGTWRAGAVLEAAGGLLTLSQGGAREDLLGPRLALHLLGAYSLGRVELGAALPAVLRQASDLGPLTSQGVTGPLVAPVGRSALGDLRLGAKAPLLGPGATWLAASPVALSAMLELRLPTGDGKAFASDGLALQPSLVATRTLGPLRLDGQLGYLLRGQGQYLQLAVRHGWTAVLGGSYELPPVGRLTAWRAIAELSGALPSGFDLNSARARAPLSLRAGLRAFLTPALSVEAGGGTGLAAAGYGHERWRAFLGLRWTGHPAPPPAPVVPKPGDRDGDGVPDPKDRCPDVPGLPALDGCPDADADEIPDPEDQCPAQPGPASHAGCPVPEDEPLVELTTEKLSLNDAITFDTDRDTIKPESFPVLDQVARLLLAHPELTRVRVEGHTDNVGSAAYNKDLSARRAASVVRHLAGKGVDARRLQAAGYGFEKPVASNATALGRARNRRVEFTLVGEGT